MVLQRDCPIHLWGWAGADEKIEIHFKGQIRKTIATNDGNWSTYLDASAYGGPYTLVVKGEQSEVEFNNVLIGDVWLCSGSPIWNSTSMMPTMLWRKYPVRTIRASDCSTVGRLQAIIRKWM